MPVTATRIELPSTYIEKEATAIDEAVNLYDPRLRFGRNTESGQWCIFMVVRGEAPLPVLGFDQMPTEDEAMLRLKRSDSQRRGAEILREIQEHNQQIKDGFEYAADQASGEAAEAFETGFRIMGKHPTPRIFIPGRADVLRQ